MKEAALLLLADSRLLFQPGSLQPLLQHLQGQSVKAAYVGAANGHDPVFYELACSALSGLFGSDIACAFVRAENALPSTPVNLVILAGGNVSLGWEFLQRPGIAQWLQQVRSDARAVLVGVSAGAIHLGRGCDPDLPAPVATSYLDWFPHFIAVHEEQHNWPSQRVWEAAGKPGQFVGIPLGGGVWQAGADQQSVGRPAFIQS